MTTMTKPTYEELDRACMASARMVLALREELAAVTSVPLFIEANESHRLAVPARYSTEAVDALLLQLKDVFVYDPSDDGGWEQWYAETMTAYVDAVRASREPPL